MAVRHCKRCHSSHLVKNGVKYKEGQSGSYLIQMLRCQNCGKSVQGERRNGSRPEVVVKPKIEVTLPVYTPTGFRIPLIWLRKFEDIVILNEGAKVRCGNQLMKPKPPTLPGSVLPVKVMTGTGDPNRS